MLAMRFPRILLLLVMASLLTADASLLLAGQTFRIQSVRVIGSQRYPEEDLVAALGFKPGDTIALDALQKAADRLMQSGALASLQYKYTPLSTGLVVEYTVADSRDFLPCSYDNIVWINSEELTKAVHQKVPLFDGEAPSSGELLDQVAQAISQLLAQRGVVTKVIYELNSRVAGAPIDAISFVSDSVVPKIRDITLTGANLLSPQEKMENTKRLVGEPYRARQLRESLVNGLFFIYGNKGYLRMQVGEPQATLVGDPQQAMVAVTVPVTEGSQFRWASISWSGNTALTKAELDSMMAIRSGDIADHSRLDTSLSAVQRAYKSRGYLAVQLKRVPTFDDQYHTVSYMVDVSEGDLFHMGNLRLLGLEPGVAEKLQKKWKLNRGDVYNGQYLQTFLKDNAGLISEGRSRTVKSTEMQTPEHLVDVTLQF